MQTTIKTLDDAKALQMLKSTLKAKGFPFFENGDYNLNLIGVRFDGRFNTGDDVFDDIFFAIFNVKGKTHILRSLGTTEPGAYYRQNPMNPRGTAFVEPGHYKGAYQIGVFNGAAALVQRGPLTVRRKRALRRDWVETGLFGIHHHRADSRALAMRVGRWSAGCQVHQDPAAFNRIIDAAGEATKIWGPKISYTLLLASDVHQWG